MAYYLFWIPKIIKRRLDRNGGLDYLEKEGALPRLRRLSRDHTGQAYLAGLNFLSEGEETAQLQFAMCQEDRYWSAYHFEKVQLPSNFTAKGDLHLLHLFYQEPEPDPGAYWAKVVQGAAPW